MTSAAAELRDFLIADMQATESTEFATDLLTKAKAKIKAGNGALGFMASTSANGKTFTSNQTLTALEVAQAARAAIDAYESADDGLSGDSITFIDFSRM